MASTDPSSNTPFRDGVIAVSPLMIGVIPFGLVFGVAAAASSVGGAIGWASSWIIFGGAAQIATIQLLDEGTTAVVVIATALIIQARHIMYSAAMAPHFREFPAAWRRGLPYLLTDQAFAVSIIRYETVTDPTYKRWFFLGAGITLWTVWQTTTGIGVLLGAQIPAAWSLEFTIPLVFLALLIPTLRTRPAVVAAAVGGTVALLGYSMPYNLGLIVGAMSGVMAGVIAERSSS
jgi:4-azaleucine resistance transporter AzlC